MYSRCLSCSRSLGSNSVVEELPIGRILAFDTDSGRIWIICRRCRNWNLVPIEERWEPVEEAERRFKDAKIEASTDHVALARCFDGTELIRIGDAPWPEVAVWRYARKAVRRYQKTVLGGGGAAGVAYVVSAVSGVGFVSIALGVTAALAGTLAVRDLSPAVQTSEGRVIRSGDGQWLQLHPSDNTYGWSLRVSRRRFGFELEGVEALRVLRRLLPRANMFGASLADTKEAATEVARSGGNDELIRGIATQLGKAWNVDPNHNPFAIGAWGRARPYRIATGTPFLRLALEMAVNDLCERRFLEGDLVELQREWREADQLAAISDDLVMPQWIRQRLQEERLEVAASKEQPGDRPGDGSPV